VESELDSVSVGGGMSSQLMLRYKRSLRRFSIWVRATACAKASGVVNCGCITGAGGTGRAGGG
jgi:hypothetical protein